MMGMSRDEILEKMDWIIEFSELEDFIDQPFRTYSTGMQARLTFATATCLEPDILIVDEALSVGDARFQRKSFGKIREFRAEGRTILLVSHDINTISAFCDYAIILERGRIFKQGEPHYIGKVYYQMLFASDKSVDGDDAVESQEEFGSIDQPDEILITVDKISKENGYAWQFDLSEWSVPGDSPESPQRSKYLLFEDSKQLGPAHSAHEQIRSHGLGAYSHWRNLLYFSTSDNTDPRRNGRVYMLRKKKDVLDKRADIAVNVQSDSVARIRQRALEKYNLDGVTSIRSSRFMSLGNGKAEIFDFGIWDLKGNKVVRLVSGERYTFFMRVFFIEDVDPVLFGFVIRDVRGVDVFGTSSRMQGIPNWRFESGDICEVSMDVTMWLTNGTYFLSYSVANPQAGPGENEQYALLFDGLEFDVEYKSDLFTPSVVNLDAKLIKVEVAE